MLYSHRFKYPELEKHPISDIEIHKEMSELKRNPQQITTEDLASPQIDESPAATDEPSVATVNKTTSPKSRGDGHQTPPFANSPFDVSNIQVASLCSVDKMRIDHLITELNKCKESKKETELRLSASKFEGTAIEKTFESCGRRHQDEKADLKSKLSMETRKLKELTTNTSRSLNILADQISAWERETGLIRETVDEMLDEIIHLKKELSRIEMREMLLTAEEARMKDTLAMKKLQFAEHQLKIDMLTMSTSDRCCQTEDTAFQFDKRLAIKLSK